MSTVARSNPTGTSLRCPGDALTSHVQKEQRPGRELGVNEGVKRGRISEVRGGKSRSRKVVGGCGRNRVGVLLRPQVVTLGSGNATVGGKGALRRGTTSSALGGGGTKLTDQRSSPTRPIESLYQQPTLTTLGS